MNLINILSVNIHLADPNKIGQKMLEKMGWTKGKGLGLNEQGNTECCRLPYKNDTTGKKKINK